MNLELLDWVYVTFDYEGTLASLDRGVESVSVLRPTRDDVAVGIAMTTAVKRDGKWKCVIVLNATYGRALSFEPDSTFTDVDGLNRLRAEGRYILAHECGYVHDPNMKTRRMSMEETEAKWSPKDYSLRGTAAAGWDEYVASRLNAD